MAGVIGVDEAGRGPLAGPVVAAAVLLCPEGIAGLNDSKKLSEKRRIALEAEIKAKCRWAIGIASVEEIGTINILKATMLAMTRAVDGLVSQPRHPGLRAGVQLGAGSKRISGTPDHVRGDESEPDISDLLILVDGNRLPAWPYPSRAIVGGDAIEPAISAASIIAKQTRDRMMVEACARYPGYGFSRHKGYGTAEHLAALKQLGPCPLHRQDFAPVRQLMLL